MPRVRGPALLILVSVLRSPPAAGEVVVRGSAELEVGGGRDDNMLLATVPDAPTSLRRLGGWFGQAAPLLSGSLSGGGLRLELTYAGDYRFADDVGHLYYQEADTTVYLPSLGPARLHLGLSGGRFDASRFPEDIFMFAGGEAGLRIGIVDWMRLNGRYRGQWRRLGFGTVSTDLLHAVDARIVYLPTSRVEVGPRGSLLLVQPRTGDGVRFIRWRAGLDGSGQLGPVTATLGGWWGTLQLGALTPESQVGGHAELRWPIGSAVDLYAAGELAHPLAGGSADYARRAFTLGVAVRASSATAPPPPPPALDLRPRVEGAKVRLRLKAAAGAQVAVLGSWDDWQPPGRRLTPTGADDVFEVWFELPPGSHRYHFVVNGQTRRPPDAARYAPDGFGGEDGVLDVDAPPKPTGDQPVPGAP